MLKSSTRNYRTKPKRQRHSTPTGTAAFRSPPGCVVSSKWACLDIHSICTACIGRSNALQTSVKQKNTEAYCSILHPLLWACQPVWCFCWSTSYWCLVGNGWEWGNGMIITSDYGSFPHSLLSTSKTFINWMFYSEARFMPRLPQQIRIVDTSTWQLPRLCQLPISWFFDVQIMTISKTAIHTLPHISQNFSLQKIRGSP